VHLEPKPFHSKGPPWFGGETVHARLLRRIVRYGSGVNPLGSPSDEDLERLRTAMVEAGRDPADLEMVGGTRGRFEDAESVVDLGEALERIPPQIERGFTTFCMKPSQFVDDPALLGSFCREVVDLVAAAVRVSARGSSPVPGSYPEGARQARLAPAKEVGEWMDAEDHGAQAIVPLAGGDGRASGWPSAGSYWSRPSG
jgi:hypothetical protein